MISNDLGVCLILHIGSRSTGVKVKIKVQYFSLGGAPKPHLQPLIDFYFLSRLYMVTICHIKKALYNF